MASLKFACSVLMCMAVVGCTNGPGHIMWPSDCIPSIMHGLKGLVSAANTTADRQAACNCLKNAAGAIPGLNPQNTEALPGKCAVSLPYKFSTSTNCATIKF